MSKRMAFITALVSIIYAVAAGWLFELVKKVIWTPLAVGIVFLVFSLALTLTISFLANILSKQSHTKPSLKKIAALLAGVFGAALLLEFAYEADFVGGGKDASSYIFVIDNSGSMYAGEFPSDPMDKRYDSIEEILENKKADFPYAVYGFSDNVEVMREMAPCLEGTEVDVEQAEYIGGGTAAYTALEYVLNEIDNNDNIKKYAGNRIKVLFLSDGYPTDGGGWFSSLFGNIRNDVIKDYQNKGIAISTIGLGEDDANMMTNLAEETGGVYAHVDDLNELTEKMDSVLLRSSNRDLLSSRHGKSHNVLYAILRWLFLSAIAVIISLIKEESCEKFYITKDISKYSSILGAIGALLIEILISWVGLNSYGYLIPRILMFLFMGITIVKKSNMYSNDVSMIEKQQY